MTSSFLLPQPASVPTASASRPNRSRFVTVFACVLLTLSALGCFVSSLAFLMMLACGHGSKSGSAFEAFIVVALPPLTLLASIGLLRRWRWAHFYSLMLLVGVIAWNVAPIIRGPSPQRTYVSASGVPTTVLATEVDYPTHVAAVIVAGGLIVVLLSTRVRIDFPVSPNLPPPTPPPANSLPPVNSQTSAAAETVRDWRVGHQGRDEMYYEECCAGQWQRLRVSGEMLMGPAHHVIYFDSAQAWRNYPEWARHRREEIIGRIKSEFREPDYEYQGDGVSRPTPSATAKPAINVPLILTVPRSSTPPSPRSAARASLLALALLLALAGVMGWLVARGLEQGTTYLPLKSSAHGRAVSRAQEPAFFWASIGLYAIVGAGAVGLGAWGVRAARQR